MTTNHRTATSALLVLSLAGAGAPVASAMPARSEGPIAAKPAPAAVYSRQDRSMIPATAPSTTPGTAAPAVIRVTSPSTGFDWGDAGIGAAGGIALSMVGLGGALAVSQNRARRARRTSVLPG